MVEIGEQKKKEIQKQAKKILENFANALAKVKFKEKEFKKDVGGFREEGAGIADDEDFRKRMFENAPEKKDDCIIAEKKTW